MCSLEGPGSDGGSLTAIQKAKDRTIQLDILNSSRLEKLLARCLARSFKVGTSPCQSTADLWECHPGRIFNGNGGFLVRFLTSVVDLRQTRGGVGGGGWGSCGCG